MIGTGRQFVEAAVSQSHTDDSDPLLDFSSERDAVGEASQSQSAPEPPAQAIAGLADPAPQPPPPSPSISIEPLIARIGRLESALEDSKIQVSALKSEVATLVRTIGDIRNSVAEVKKRARRPEAIRIPSSWRIPARPSRTVSVILAAIVGLGGGIFGWVYLRGPADSPVGTLPETSQETAFAPADQPVAPTVSPSPAPVPVAARVPAQGSRVNYFGSLSIDSEPGGEVFLNRESVGHTPLRLAKLKAGSHLVWVERDGYRRFTRVVEVPADRVTRLFADLELLSAR